MEARRSGTEGVMIGGRGEAGVGMFSALSTAAQRAAALRSACGNRESNAEEIDQQARSLGTRKVSCRASLALRLAANRRFRWEEAFCPPLNSGFDSNCTDSFGAAERSTHGTPEQLNSPLPTADRSVSPCAL